MLIPATAAVACATSASVTRLPGATGRAGVGAGVGVVAGAGAALGDSGVGAATGADADGDGDGDNAAALALLWLAGAAELADGDAGPVVAASGADVQPASSATVPSAATVATQRRRIRTVRRGPVTRMPSSTGTRGRYR